jgi:hypothetical protein
MLLSNYMSTSVYTPEDENACLFCCKREGAGIRMPTFGLSDRITGGVGALACALLKHCLI